MFQSTPSRRGRRGKTACPGCGAGRVSIHSLTQRETGESPPPTKNITRFNPLPHAEGDLLIRTDIFLFKVSIHSLTQRETQCWGSLKRREERFQSTPSRRGRRCLPSWSFPQPCFNPLPHAEGDRYRNRGRRRGGGFQSTPSRRGRRAGA